MSNLFHSAKVTEFLPVFGKSCQFDLPSVTLLFVKICLSIFLFDVWDKLWVLIRPVPEVSLLL